MASIKSLRQSLVLLSNKHCRHFDTTGINLDPDGYQKSFDKKKTALAIVKMARGNQWRDIQTRIHSIAYSGIESYSLNYNVSTRVVNEAIAIFNESLPAKLSATLTIRPRIKI